MCYSYIVSWELGLSPKKYIEYQKCEVVMRKATHSFGEYCFQISFGNVNNIFILKKYIEMWFKVNLQFVSVGSGDGLVSTDHKSLPDPMMTSSNGNLLSIIGFLCGEFTCHRWIPLTKVSEAELWRFSSICAWTNEWAYNREFGDFGRHCAHYDVTVMQCQWRPMMLFGVTLAVLSSFHTVRYIVLSLPGAHPTKT